MVEIFHPVGCYVSRIGAAKLVGVSIAGLFARAWLPRGTTKELYCDNREKFRPTVLFRAQKIASWPELCVVRWETRSIQSTKLLFGQTNPLVEPWISFLIFDLSDKKETLSFLCSLFSFTSYNNHMINYIINYVSQTVNLRSWTVVFVESRIGTLIVPIYRFVWIQQNWLNSKKHAVFYRSEEDTRVRFARNTRVWFLLVLFDGAH